VVQPLIGILEKQLWWFRRFTAFEKATLVVLPLYGIWRTRIDLNNLGSPQRKYLTGENIPAKGTVICRPAYERVATGYETPRDVESIPGHL
jgi:hypothetical protein